MKKFATIFVFLVACACNPVAGVKTPDTENSPCARACGQMQKLGCEEGNPVSTGERCYIASDCVDGMSCINNECAITCTTFCESSKISGFQFNTSCLSVINSCSQVDACFQE